VNTIQEPKIFQLPDGRRLSYDEHGPPNGQPVFYFHGAPSSRLDIQLMPPDWQEQDDLRVIAVDRPGMGLSDFQSGRGFSHWPADVAAMADGLGLERFAVLGVSGGAGYAAVSARLIPERLAAVVIVSGAGRMDWPEAMQGLPPANRLIWKLAARSNWLPALPLALMRMMLTRNPSQVHKQMAASLPPPDAALFSDPRLLDVFIASVLESMRQGSRGPVWDMCLYARPWDFRLEEIAFPITILHGEQDKNVPPAVARRLAASIPDCRAIFFPQEAHLSTPYNQFREIIAALTGS
jgi:pimeloyl-ACP methyl ester carboxylesterase